MELEQKHETDLNRVHRKYHWETADICSDHRHELKAKDKQIEVWVWFVCICNPNINAAATVN